MVKYTCPCPGSNRVLFFFLMNAGQKQASANRWMDEPPLFRMEERVLHQIEEGFRSIGSGCPIFLFRKPCQGTVLEASSLFFWGGLRVISNFSLLPDPPSRSLVQVDWEWHQESNLDQGACSSLTLIAQHQIPGRGLADHGGISG